MNNASIVGLLAILAISLLSGCSENVDSKDIRTSGIYAAMNLSSTADNKNDIDVVLLVGGKYSNTYVDLTAGDILTATLNSSETIRLARQKESNGKVYYTGGFLGSVAGAENSIIRVSLERPSPDVSALNSTVTLPSAPSGIMADKTSFSRSQDNITLTWNRSQSENPLTMTYEGDCIRSGGSTVPDNGLYTINAGTITDQNEENCKVNFTFYREINGSLDIKFGEGGYIKAKQSRSYSLVSSR